MESFSRICVNPDRLVWCSIPFLALVDADPYGIDIMSVFKYGSASMAHEHATSTTPTLRWVGLKSSELDRLVKSLLFSGPSCECSQTWRRPWALVPITRHDEKKVSNFSSSLGLLLI